MQDYKRLIWLTAICFALIFGWPRGISAAPYFYLYGTSSAAVHVNQTWLVGLFTDGDTLTASQTVVNFDESLMQFVQMSNLSSRCSFWAPADPLLGFGNGSTPYVKDNNKIVISCGFSNPGYKSTNGVGDVIMAITLKPLRLDDGSFSFSDTQLRYIGDTILPGDSPAYDFSVNSVGTPSPTPTPTPSPSPTPAPPNVDTLSLSDINTVNIESGTPSGSNSTGEDTESGLTAAALDDTIPPPPDDLEKRANATPYAYSTASSSANQGDGDILSLQSLKELLIPGKSPADKNLVLFNFLMIITFLILLAILVWRLIVSRRFNKLKYKHMNDILEGELSVMESKLEGVKQGVVTGEELTSSLEELKEELESQT